jgi:hypothetical protein
MDAPTVRLGALRDDGIAASIYALVERGVKRRPAFARMTLGEVELRFAEGYAPTRIAFRGDEVLVEDGDAVRPDLIVSGSLPDVVHLTSAPMVGGVPNPLGTRGRAALGRLARRRVRLRGSSTLGRRLLRILAL